MHKVIILTAVCFCHLSSKLLNESKHLHVTTTIWNLDLLQLWETVKSGHWLCIA